MELRTSKELGGSAENRSKEKLTGSKTNRSRELESAENPSKEKLMGSKTNHRKSSMMSVKTRGDQNSDEKKDSKEKIEAQKQKNYPEEKSARIIVVGNPARDPEFNYSSALPDSRTGPKPRRKRRLHPLDRVICAVCMCRQLNLDTPVPFRYRHMRCNKHLKTQLNGVDKYYLLFEPAPPQDKLVHLVVGMFVLLLLNVALFSVVVRLTMLDFTKDTSILYKTSAEFAPKPWIPNSKTLDDLKRKEEEGYQHLRYLSSTTININSCKIRESNVTRDLLQKDWSERMLNCVFGTVLKRDTRAFYYTSVWSTRDGDTSCSRGTNKNGLQNMTNEEKMMVSNKTKWTSVYPQAVFPKERDEIFLLEVDPGIHLRAYNCLIIRELFHAIRDVLKDTWSRNNDYRLMSPSLVGRICDTKHNKPRSIVRQCSKNNLTFQPNMDRLETYAITMITDMSDIGVALLAKKQNFTMKIKCGSEQKIKKLDTCFSPIQLMERWTSADKKTIAVLNVLDGNFDTLVALGQTIIHRMKSFINRGQIAQMQIAQKAHPTLIYFDYQNCTFFSQEKNVSKFVFEKQDMEVEERDIPMDFSIQMLEFSKQTVLDSFIGKNKTAYVETWDGPIAN